MRIEDLDEQRCRPEYAARQLEDLAAIGLEWDLAPVRQSARLAEYRRQLDVLVADGRTFECYCSRKEIRQAQSAPHGDTARYPGTCRTLTRAQRERRRRDGRPATVRLRADAAGRAWHDLVRGPQWGVADDVVLRRWDGALAYNLAVVVDDIWQGVDEIVRGDDLIDQTATQLLLTELLGGSAARYGHVPLVLNPEGRRLAKRDGAVTLAGLRALGRTIEDVVRLILGSLGSAVPSGAETLRAALDGFDLAGLPRAPWRFAPPADC